jgi:hypothetical protein
MVGAVRAGSRIQDLLGPLILLLFRFGAGMVGVLLPVRSDLAARVIAMD